jgi:hypothetical protein
VPVDVDLMMDKPSAGSDKVTGSDGGAVMSAKRKNKKRSQAKEPEPEPTTFGKWRQGWAEWWKDVLEQAKKK